MLERNPENRSDPFALVNPAKAGRDMHALVTRLYPICRSITGPGVRDTLAILRETLPIETLEVPTGTRVFDWEIPKEWSIRDAYIKNSTGERIVDFRKSNLHVVNYSVPVRAQLSWEQLRPHLHSLPDHPDWIPYRTTYYDANWGFCLPHRLLEQMERQPEARYEVRIDSSLKPGSLNYAQLLAPGDSHEEVLFSCHVCHPSLANDNLSGIAVAVKLAEYIRRLPRRRYSYRFLFVPGTIGAIAWLSQHEELVPHIRHGLVLALLGDNGQTTYKRTRCGNAGIDRAVSLVLRDSGKPYEIRDFSPIGYDERQYGSPGLDMPVGCLMRTPNGEYPQYHTSADDLDFVTPDALADSLDKCIQVVEVLENDRRCLNLNPKCEPQLGKRGLYQAIGGEPDRQDLRDALLWVLNLSDGQHGLLEIAERSKLPFAKIRRAADLLQQHDLLGTAKPVAPVVVGNSEAPPVHA